MSAETTSPAGASDVTLYDVDNPAPVI